PKKRSSGKGGADEGLDLTKPALDALKRIGSPKAIEDLIAFLQKQSAATSGGSKKKPKQGGDDALSKDAAAALHAITGQSCWAAACWRKWCSESRASLKLVQVFRCEGTGRTFEKDKKACPYDGDQHPHCGYFVKSKIAGVSG